MQKELISSLSYISTARANLTESDFTAILNEASQRNEALGLTGLLAFNGLNFMQVLEGTRENVALCIGLIEADRRHDGMVIFDRRQTNEREFPGWKMAGIVVNPDDHATKMELDKLLSGECVRPETRMHFDSFNSFGTQAV